MSIRAQLWVEVVFEILGDRAMLSTEIADVLKSSGRGGRYPPSPLRVTFVLRSDKRFRELGDEIIGTIARNRSHPVKLIGRRDKSYHHSAPYRILRVTSEEDLE